MFTERQSGAQRYEAHRSPGSGVSTPGSTQAPSVTVSSLGGEAAASQAAEPRKVEMVTFPGGLLGGGCVLAGSSSSSSSSSTGRIATSKIARAASREVI